MVGKPGKDLRTLRPLCLFGVNGAFKMEMETRKSKSKSSWTVTLPEGSLGRAATADSVRCFHTGGAHVQHCQLLAGQSSSTAKLKKRIVLIHLLWPVQAGSPGPGAAHWGKSQHAAV